MFILIDGHTCLFKKKEEFKYKQYHSEHKAGFDLYKETWIWERCVFCNCGVGECQSKELVNHISYKDIPKFSFIEWLKNLFR